MCISKLSEVLNQECSFGNPRLLHTFAMRLSIIQFRAINMHYTLEGLKMYYDMNSYMGIHDFIYFWKPEEKDGEISKACLCQWYPCCFYVNGIQYNCAEQFMMAEKARVFGDDNILEQIMDATDPADIKHLGRKVKNFVPSIWDNLSYDIVVRGNVAKFCQNPKLLGFLLLTDTKVLVEASPNDTIWGIGMDEETARQLYPHKWKGKNKLGFALMDVRDIIKEKVSHIV